MVSAQSIEINTLLNSSSLLLKTVLINENRPYERQAHSAKCAYDGPKMTSK